MRLLWPDERRVLDLSTNLTCHRRDTHFRQTVTVAGNSANLLLNGRINAMEDLALLGSLGAD